MIITVLHLLQWLVFFAAPFLVLLQPSKLYLRNDLGNM